MKLARRNSVYLEKVSDGKRIRFLSLIRGSSSVAVKHIKLKARKHNRRKRLNFIFRLDVYASSHDTGYHTTATELGSNYSHNYSTIVSDLIRPDARYTWKPYVTRNKEQG